MIALRTLGVACLCFLALAPAQTASAQDAESALYGRATSCDALRSYLRAYPDGRFRANAEARVAKDCNVIPAPKQQTAKVEEKKPEIAAVDYCAQARADWPAIQASEDTRVLSAFIKATPAVCAVQLSQAQSRLQTVEESARARSIADAEKVKQSADQQNLWVLAQKSDSTTVYEEYLRSFPSGEHVQAAKDAISRLTRPPPPAAERVSGHWTRRQGDCARFYEINAGGGMFEFRFGGSANNLGSLRKARIVSETANAVVIAIVGQQWTFTATSDDTLMWDTPSTRCFLDRAK